MNRRVLVFAVAVLAGCQDSPSSAPPDIPQPRLTDQDEKRLTGLIRKYQTLRSRLRVPGIPDEYLDIQQDRYVIEQEMKRIEPLALTLAQQREDGLDRRFQAKENTEAANRILNESDRP